MVSSSRSQFARTTGQMRTALRETPHDRVYVSHVLPGGLEVIVARVSDQHRVTLRRQDRPPSDHECEVIGAQFGVPTGTEPEWYERKLLSLASNRPEHYYVAEMVWREIPARRVV